MQLIADNKYYTVLKINSYEAIRIYGSNTKWCIVANELHWDNYYEYDYSGKKNEIFYINHKLSPKYNKEKDEGLYKKIAIVWDDGGWTVWDSADNQLDEDGFHEFYVEGDTNQYLDDTNEELTTVLNDVNYKLDVDFSKVTPQQAKDILTKRSEDYDEKTIEKLKQILLKDFMLSVLYVMSAKKPFLELEEKLLRSNQLNAIVVYLQSAYGSIPTAFKIKIMKLLDAMVQDSIEGIGVYRKFVVDNFDYLYGNGINLFNYFSQDVKLLDLFAKKYPENMTAKLERYYLDKFRGNAINYFINYRTRGGKEFNQGVVNLLADALLNDDNNYGLMQAFVNSEKLTSRLTQKHEQLFLDMTKNTQATDLSVEFGGKLGRIMCKNLIWKRVDITPKRV